MAGSQHPSVTGMDERTLGRIDLILFDADYRDANAAIEDSWRVAVMAADPRTRTAHEHARVAAVRTANERRDPSAPRVPTSSTLHRVALGAALLAGVAAVALLTTPRTLALQDVILPAGLLAVLAVALLYWLEPRRANGSLWGSGLPAVIHLAFGGMWLLAAAAVFAFRWGEVGTFAALPAISGLTLLGCAGLAALILCGYAYRADRSGRQTGIARVTGDLIDQQDAPLVFDALDRWWSIAGPDALEHSGDRVRDVRREVLARLKAAMLITERDERIACWAPEPVKWAERLSDSEQSETWRGSEAAIWDLARGRNLGLARKRCQGGIGFCLEAVTRFARWWPSDLPRVWPPTAGLGSLQRVPLCR